MNSALRQFIDPLFSSEHPGRFFFIIIFIITSIYFGMLQVFPSMPDPDGYFHAVMGVLTWQQGFVSSFPYLPETILATYWTDQHWLYHVLLSPLTQILNPLWAVKIFTAVLGVGYMMIFFKLLERMLGSSRVAFWWTILLLTAGPFVLRIVLVKAQPLALMLLLVGLYLYSQRRYGLLFITQIIYVLAHGSFLLLPSLIVWSLLYDLFFNRKKFFSLSSLTVPGLLTLGIVIGLIVQPTFPENLLFYWYQIVHIGFIGVPELTLTGTEWNSISGIGLLKSLGVVSFISMATLIPIIHFRIRLSRSIYFWIWLLIPLIILSLLSIRNFEFFVPFLIIALALVWQEIGKYIDSKKLIERLLQSHIIALFYSTVVIVSFLLVMLTPLVKIYAWQETAVPFIFLQEEARFLKTLSNQDSIVINTRWDIFPMLLYHSDNVRLLTGMDPAFYFFANPEGYRALVKARESGDVMALINSLQQEYMNVYLAMHSGNSEEKIIPHSDSHTLTLIFDGILVSIYEVGR
jgi:hypothetical protein